MLHLDIIWDHQFILALLAGVLSGVIRGFSGFGAGLVMTPLLALIYGPADAVIIMFLTVVIGGMQMIPNALPIATKRDLIPMAIGCLIATPIGTYILINADPEIMRRVIGGFVLLSALVMLMGWSYTGQRSSKISFFAGVLSGVANGAGGVGGPPVTIYLISSNEPAAIKRANIAIASTLQAIFTIVPLTVAGMISFELIFKSIVLLPPFVGAMIIGGKLFNRANDRLYRLLALWLLVIIGIIVTTV